MNNLDWEIEYQMEDYQEEMLTLFSQCKRDIASAYWSVKHIFVMDRQVKHQEDYEKWVAPHLDPIPESNHKILLEKNLYHVFTKSHDWLGNDEFENKPDELVTVLKQLPFEELLGALTETICYQCR